ncbi:MAG TPA: TonB family protein [Gemmatimonadaceae bacterium]|nr:TonB family protein [Gemmatimonadaceae bacterium]
MSSARKFFVRALVACALVAGLPALSAAQEKVYTAAELTTRPKIASMTRTAQLVQRSYPEKLKSAGVNGTVEVQFVVGPDGKVEGGTVEVVAATVPALAAAAKSVAEKIEFEPGKVNDAPVRTRVLLPIVYKAH